MTPQTVRNAMGRPSGRPIPYLRAWRDAKLITATDLADRADVSRTALSRIEHGSNASYETIRKLATALGIAPEELLSKPTKR